ncbi:hypothetical protein F4604DRAFT_1681126 [Suillus subluteus]|nr:hypothetical protein F4604DRAFT_1681126 [Suillus subluteus]
MNGDRLGGGMGQRWTVLRINEEDCPVAEADTDAEEDMTNSLANRDPHVTKMPVTTDREAWRICVWHWIQTREAKVIANTLAELQGEQKMDFTRICCIQEKVDDVQVGP